MLEEATCFCFQIWKGVVKYFSI